MAFIEITVATVSAVHAAVVREHSLRLLVHCSTLSGYRAGWVINGYRPDEVGLLTVWETRAAADGAVTDPQALALRARIRVAAAGRLRACSYTGEGPVSMDERGVAFDPDAVVRAAQKLLERERWSS
jgi:hypothetical protein